MIDYLMTHPHVVVLIITTILWGGIGMYLLRLDKRLAKLENTITTSELEKSSSSEEIPPS